MLESAWIEYLVMHRFLTRMKRHEHVSSPIVTLNSLNKTVIFADCSALFFGSSGQDPYNCAF